MFPEKAKEQQTFLFLAGWVTQPRNFTTTMARLQQIVVVSFVGLQKNNIIVYYLHTKISQDMKEVKSEVMNGSSRSVFDVHQKTKTWALHGSATCLAAFFRGTVV